MKKVFSPDEKNQWTAPIKVIIPQCGKCKKWIGLNEKDRPVCEAYPNGIPKALIMEKVDHFRENYPGDNGILGEPKEANSPQTVPYVGKPEI